MPRYLAYGSVLESEIPFPDLPSADAHTDAARWTIMRREALPAMHDARPLGEEPLYQDVAARLVAHRDGWRISVDDTGAFDLRDDGQILAAPLASASADFLRAHLLGRVLATAQYRAGWLPLHGSAVWTAEGIIAFLAPKGAGKSSLAAALVQAGAPLVTDDTLPIEPSAPPRAWPGITTLRIRDDARTQLGLGDSGTPTHENKRAIALQGLPMRAGPLAALFLLSPTEPEQDGAVARRLPFSPVLAAAALTAHVKCGRMLGAGAAAAVLARVASIVHLVPVHQLSVARDLARLPEVAHEVLQWYGGPAR